ncbi:MAG: Fic family protein, partial [Chlamydiota bacterium]
KHTQVRARMDSLLKWSNTSTREDPLIRTALLFAQLLIIHPFMDGNGRIARILVPLFLFRKEAIAAPLLFVSSYFQSLRLRYYQNLYAITENESWEKWVCFFLKGIISCAKKQTQVLSSLIALKESLPQMPAATLRMLFETPLFTRSSFKKSKGTDALLNELVRSQCVEKWKRGKFVFKSLIKTIEKTSKSKPSEV